MAIQPYVLHLDETVRKPFLGLGGFICRTVDVPSIEQRWGRVKVAMGLERNMELKWNLAEDHHTRLSLRDSRRRNQGDRAPAMVEAIAGMDLTAVCDVLIDSREMPGRDALDFYRHALKWVLAQFANFLGDQDRPAGPHHVVADSPPATKEMKDPDFRDNPAYEWLDRRTRIALDVYEELYLSGFKGYRYPPPDLREAGFYPSLLTSHADANPCLQVADVIVGATTQCVKENLTNYRIVESRRALGNRRIEMRDQNSDQNMPALWQKYRGVDRRRVIPMGLGVFPPERTEGWHEFHQKTLRWY
jgi:hypothetical protein